MKMQPGKKYRLLPQARAQPRLLPLPSIAALADDLDTINADLVQATKLLQRAADATFDLARKLSLLSQAERTDESLPQTQED